MSYRKALPALILLDAAFAASAVLFLGASEANPVCVWLLSVGAGFFIMTKVVVAALAYILLHTWTKRGRVVVWAYFALVLWDLMVILYYVLGGR